MNAIARAMLPSAAACAVFAGTYLWRMLHVWPPGKDSWIEEGMTMFAYHALCLTILAPFVIWSVARAWSKVGVSGKVGLVFMGIALLVATVVLPEMVLKRIQRVNPNLPTDTRAIGLTTGPS